ncbi:hypothetical protein ASPWEDRAFT_371976 [Aspergillus wentii DTO 134E9]|uniref:Uncharacterized protein n=1 Tax=Aspergillus wentii DTO 134E9 TaxID=1073089 RepID=A0A1L9RX04_ASPWE|nr:uncharacterized protein ASPWEDRAFT_371976 [Aspergillus wentii DTO 134E9]OJJ39387.1 hypothetical protein ASPWEDRAFT_371976 [Aspergillus wentii DTO 134E9]
MRRWLLLVNSSVSPSPSLFLFFPLCLNIYYHYENYYFLYSVADYPTSFFRLFLSFLFVFLPFPFCQSLPPSPSSSSPFSFWLTISFSLSLFPPLPPPAPLPSPLSLLLISPPGLREPFSVAAVLPAPLLLPPPSSHPPGLAYVIGWTPPETDHFHHKSSISLGHSRTCSSASGWEGQITRTFLPHSFSHSLFYLTTLPFAYTLSHYFLFFHFFFFLFFFFSFCF